MKNSNNLFKLTLILVISLLLSACTVKSYYRTPFNKVKNNPTIQLDWKGRYKGQVDQNNRRSGLGVNLLRSDDFLGHYIHFGNWLDNSPHGQGVYIPTMYHRGAKSIYVGNYQDGRKYGFGREYNNKGNLIWEGNSSYSHRTGSKPETSERRFERLGDVRGNIFVGETHNGLRSGYGAYIWNNGDLWFGIWSNNSPTTDGIFIPLKGRMVKGKPYDIINAKDLDKAVERVVNTIQSDISPNTKIVVLNITSNRQSVSSDLIDMISLNLVRLRKFALINRNALETLREEQRFQLSSEVNNRTAVEIGRIIGAEVVLTGRVTFSGMEPRLILQALDINTAKVLSIAVEDQSRSPFTRPIGGDNTIQKAVQNITNNMPVGLSIAVLPPDNTIDNIILHDLILAQLHQTKKFNLVNRQDANVIQMERRFQQSGEVDTNAALEFGRMLGANTVVTGRLINIEGQERLILQAVDIQSSKIISMTVERESQPSNALKNIESSINKTINVMSREIPENKTIAVLNIDSRNAVTSSYSIDLAMLNFYNTGKFTLVNRQSLDVLRQERNFQFAGDIDYSTAVEVGKMIGADVVISGRWITYENQLRLIMQALDTQTARVVSMDIVDEKPAISGKARGFDAVLKKAVDSMVNDIPTGSSIAVLEISSTPISTVDMVMHNLHQSNKFTIVNRSVLNTIRTEQRFQFSGEVEDNTAVDLGKMMGASVVITGRIIGSGDSKQLMLQALDVQTARVVGMAMERL